MRIFISLENKKKDLMSKTGKIPCLKKGGPPSKPKYILLIDSVQVPWGKGEKDP